MLWAPLLYLSRLPGVEEPPPQHYLKKGLYIFSLSDAPLPPMNPAHVSLLPTWLYHWAVAQFTNGKGSYRHKDRNKSAPWVLKNTGTSIFLMEYNNDMLYAAPNPNNNKNIIYH
jgi:hypothetical protein